MKGKIILPIALLILLVLTGSASAARSADIQYFDGNTVQTVNDGATITLPVNVFADTTPIPDLQAIFSGGWTSGDTYTIIVKDIETGSNVYSNSGVLTGNQNFPIHWMPTKISPNSQGQNVYEILVTGTSLLKTSKIFVIVTTDPNITPELPTSALMAVGLIGLVSLARFRRKN